MGRLGAGDRHVYPVVAKSFVLRVFRVRFSSVIRRILGIAAYSPYVKFRKSEDTLEKRTNGRSQSVLGVEICATIGITLT